MATNDWWINAKSGERHTLILKSGLEIMSGETSLPVRDAVKRTFIYSIYRQLADRKVLRDWQARGRPAPPPQFIKQRTVKEYARRFHINTFVETGTYLGDMVHACRNTFRRIFSVEVDGQLYQRAQDRFRNMAHISIVHGDSADLLHVILETVTSPCLFWLDGHHSGGITGRGRQDTPIRRELDCILAHRVAGHVILIDDARCFTGHNDYPTLEELRQIVANKDLNRICEVRDDIVRVHDRENA